METFKILLVISAFASVVFSSESTSASKLPEVQSSLKKENLNPLNSADELKDNSTRLSRAVTGANRAGAVTVLEQYNRVNPDGSTETKLALSNGVTQYKKITSKLVNGRIIQVQQGYNTERLPNNTYRTTYYIADENGYRLTKREVQTNPGCTYCQVLV